MNKKFLSLALLFALVLAFSGVCFAGDGSDYRQLQETSVFKNTSGYTLSAGNVVILDTAGDVTAGTTLGGAVTITTASDSVLVVGVVQESQTNAISDSPVVVVTRGPVDTYAADATDAISINTAVGTSAWSNCIAPAGGGTNLGIALEAGGGTDGEKVIVWVAPTGAD